MAKMTEGEYAELWEKAESVQGVAERSGYTVLSAARKASDMRRRGAYMKRLPMEPGGEPVSQRKVGPERKKRQGKTVEKEETVKDVSRGETQRIEGHLAVVTPRELSDNQEAAIYCAATFDSFGVIEPRNRPDGSIRFALRITTTRKCMVDYVYVYFGGEIIEMGIDADVPAYQLSFPKDEDGLRFLTAIAPYTQCNQDKMMAARDFLETAALMREAEKKFAAAFGSY